MHDRELSSTISDFRPIRYSKSVLVHLEMRLFFFGQQE